MIATYKIISLRAQANGFKQRDVKTAGTFGSYEEACAKANWLNETNGRIWTTYMAQKVTQ